MRSVGPERFRAVMGHFATGVTVVTVAGADGPIGGEPLLWFRGGYRS